MYVYFLSHSILNARELATDHGYLAQPERTLPPPIDHKKSWSTPILLLLFHPHPCILL
jgi:hypothetical protein